MEDKKKHISNRHPADALNEGLRFDEQLKAKKLKKEEKLNSKGEKGKTNSTEKLGKK